ncbi:MAG: RnfH family protein [Gammaproteobacteria bacterium]|nr:RnfH family protein [Gammaproteobacteria bacterium]
MQDNTVPDKQTIHVEVSYALPHEQHLISLNVDAGSTAEKAIQLSGLLERYPDIDIGKVNKIGVFGKLTKLDRVLKQGDRVEIYRPLIADPKEVRRKRAAQGKVMTKGAKEKNT